MMIPGNESDTTSEVTLWLRDDRAARVDASRRMITRLDRGELYIVNDADRSYTVLPITRGDDTDTSPGPYTRTRREQVAEGYFADIAVFDAATREEATFVEPHQYASGFEVVIVNRTIVLEAGERSEAFSGEVLRGPITAAI